MNEDTNLSPEKRKMNKGQAKVQQVDTNAATIKNIKREEYFKKEFTNNIDRLMNDK